jgi:uncharacterized protein DUF1206
MMATMEAEKAGRAFTDSRMFEVLARAGYVARGVIYLLIGALAIRLSQGISGPRPSQQGALRTISHQPFGKTLLVIMAVGLAGYAIWRLLQALVGHTPEYGKHSKGDRIGAVGSGLAYLAFCVLAVSELRGTAGNSSAKTKETTARVLDWPAGREIVAAVGLVFIGVAAYQAYLGLSKTFLKYSKTGEMGPTTRDGFKLIGEVGIVARAVTFLLIGLFVVKAAWDYNSREAVGIDGALARLTQHAYGTTALLVVACGLIIFGAYSLADARFRKI